MRFLGLYFIRIFISIKYDQKQQLALQRVGFLVWIFGWSVLKGAKFFLNIKGCEIFCVKNLRGAKVFCLKS